MKVALAQIVIDYASPIYNLNSISDLCSSAKSKGAEVIVFPEYSITGPLRGKKYSGKQYAHYVDLLRSIAKENSIDLIPGSLIEQENEKFFNTSLYIEKNGNVISKYRKINLWHGEISQLSSGTSVSVFDTSFGKCGLAICWDLMNPTIFRAMARAGAKYIFVPSFWSDYGKANTKYEVRNINTLCYARALENGCAIIFANAAGNCGSPKPDDNLVGHSQVCVPIRDKIKLTDHNRQSLSIVDINEAPFALSEQIYKIKSGFEKNLLKE